MFDVCRSDLTAWKPEVGRSLQTMLDYGNDDFESVFCLNFTYSVEAFGAVQTVELKPGGEAIAVTQANKQGTIASLTALIERLLRYAAFAL